MRRVPIVTPVTIAACLLLQLTLVVVKAQDTGNTAPTVFRPARIAEAPVIDGDPGDWTWQTAPISEPFLTYNPTRGEILPQRTEIWVAYDDENLYFAFRCHDDEADQIRATITARDEMFSDDWVGLSMDVLGTSGSWPEIVPGRSIFDIHARMEFDELKNPLVLEFLPSYTYGSSQVRATSTSWGDSDASDDFGMGREGHRDHGTDRDRSTDRK